MLDYSVLSRVSTIPSADKGGGELSDSVAIAALSSRGYRASDLSWRVGCFFCVFFPPRNASLWDAFMLILVESDPDRSNLLRVKISFSLGRFHGIDLITGSVNGFRLRVCPGVRFSSKQSRSWGLGNRSSPPFTLVARNHSLVPSRKPPLKETHLPVGYLKINNCLMKHRNLSVSGVSYGVDSVEINGWFHIRVLPQK